MKISTFWLALPAVLLALLLTVSPVSAAEQKTTLLQRGSSLKGGRRPQFFEEDHHPHKRREEEEEVHGGRPTNHRPRDRKLFTDGIWEAIRALLEALFGFVFNNDDDPPTEVTLAPSPAATGSPTGPPTGSPTGSPTDSPTGPPTPQPTGAPNDSTETKTTVSPTAAPSESPSSPPPPTSQPAADPVVATPDRCSCFSCNETIWETDARGFTCGARIDHLLDDEPDLYMTEEAACARVAGIEYPRECGSCDPASCDDNVPPNPPRASYCGACGDNGYCTLDVWKSVTDRDDFLSCEALITWVQTHDDARAAEIDACRLVAEQHPLTSCGKLCNPATCDSASDGDPLDDRFCGCEDCTDAILDRDASRPGEPATCRDRIQFLMRNPPDGGVSYTEEYACAAVAGEFPEICGPQCDPSLCDGQEPDPKNKIICDNVVTTPEFGDYVWFMDPSMTTSVIQGIFDCLLDLQVNNEMGSERYVIYFLPGTYGSAADPLNVLIGYYTEVAGLGETPQETVINGKIEVYNRCFSKHLYEDGVFNPDSPESGETVCFALNNFWRALANLSINIVHSSTTGECRRRAMFWGISQASSMRRVDIRGGDLSLMDYCSQPGFASGGFIADSRHSGGFKIFNGGQQQFFTRNSVLDKWDGAVWNNVLMGNTIQVPPPVGSFPGEPFTTFEFTPTSREKPFIFFKDGEYFVNVDPLKTDSSGVSWSNGRSDGLAIPLSDFFLARPTDSVAEINSRLLLGKHVIFLPGVYDVSESIVVGRSDSIVLGLGLATLKANQGAIPLVVQDRPGVIIAGITIDAGSVESPVLLKVGEPGSSGVDSSNPITLSDVYFRIGGPYIGKADIALEVNSNNVLIDHCWVWRADHGIEPFDNGDGFAGDNQRWAQNIGRKGVVVNGNDVTATGLFVEHFQEDNLIWNGEKGRVFFFQNELPYDAPTQADWPANLVGYRVNDAVDEHELWGGGVYCYNRNNPSIVTDNGFKVPTGKPGVKMERVYTRNLSGPGSILAVINEAGTTVSSANPGPEYVVSFSG